MMDSPLAQVVREKNRLLLTAYRLKRSGKLKASERFFLLAATLEEWVADALHAAGSRLWYTNALSAACCWVEAGHTERAVSLSIDVAAKCHDINVPEYLVDIPALAIPVQKALQAGIQRPTTAVRPGTGVVVTAGDRTNTVDHMIEYSISGDSQNSRRGRRDQLQDKNRGQLDNAISRLENARNLTWMDDLIGMRKNLEDFWADARDVGVLFKEAKPLRREDRKHLWERFQKVCDKARCLQDEIDRERDRKQAEWRDHMHEKIERLRALIDKNEGVIERLDQQIDHCEGLRSDAKTSDFADEVGGWIREKEDKKDDILQTNRELWDQIAEIERKLQS